MYETAERINRAEVRRPTRTAALSEPGDQEVAPGGKVQVVYERVQMSSPDSGLLGIDAMLTVGETGTLSRWEFADGYWWAIVEADNGSGEYWIAAEDLDPAATDEADTDTNDSETDTNESETDTTQEADMAIKPTQADTKKACCGTCSKGEDTDEQKGVAAVIELDAKAVATIAQTVDEKLGAFDMRMANLEREQRNMVRLRMADVTGGTYRAEIDTYDELRERLEKALNDKYRGDDDEPVYVWVADVMLDGSLFYFEHDGAYWQQTFDVGDETVTLTGEPAEVRREVTYETV